MAKLILIKEWTKFEKRTCTWELKRVWEKIYYLCICDCWIKQWVYWYHLRKWISTQCKSCSNNWWHWLSYTRFYKIWQWIKQRCFNVNHNTYKNYWAKWIMCEWNSFEEFKDDMYESYIEHVNKYWAKQTTIDRINFKWNYSKQNCRWATNKEQHNNQRKRTVWNTWMTSKELSNIYWFTKKTILTYSNKYKDKLIDELNYKKNKK